MKPRLAKMKIGDVEEAHGSEVADPTKPRFPQPRNRQKGADRGSVLRKITSQLITRSPRLADDFAQAAATQASEGAGK